MRTGRQGKGAGLFVYLIFACRLSIETSSLALIVKKRSLNHRRYIHALIQVEICTSDSPVFLSEFSCMFFRPEEYRAASK
jgi:hypothetical protein